MLSLASANAMFYEICQSDNAPCFACSAAMTPMSRSFQFFYIPARCTVLIERADV
jgi:hypothetical protein